MARGGGVAAQPQVPVGYDMPDYNPYAQPVQPSHYHNNQFSNLFNNNTFSNLFNKNNSNNNNNNQWMEYFSRNNRNNN